MRNKLGQHILKSKRILKEIVRLASISQQDVVLEPGAGPGNFTEEIAAAAQKVYAVEIDAKFVSILKEKFKENSRVVIVAGDVLKIDWPADVTKVVGNIPYNISSALIEKLVQKRIPHAFLMLQQEFADRLVSSDQTPGRITLLARYLYDCRVLKKIPPKFFSPPPKVHSVLVELRRVREPLPPQAEKIYFKLARVAFSARRKKLYKNLRCVFEKEVVDKIFKEFGFSPPVRAQELPPEIYRKIAYRLYEVSNLR